MNCEQMMELMQRFVDKDLTQTEEQRLMDHISQCPECAASFEQLQLISAELSLLPMVSPPYSIVDSILPKLAELDAQQAAIHVAYMPSVNRRKKAIFSWKAAAGFVAAAAIFSLIAINLAPSVKQDASEMKLGMSTKSSAVMDKGQGEAGAAAPAEPMAKSEVSSVDAAAKTNETMNKFTAAETPASKKVTSTDSKLKFEPSIKGLAPQPSVTPAPVTRSAAQAAASPAPAAQAALPTPAPQAAASPSSHMQAQANQTLASVDGNFIGLVERQIVQVNSPDGNRIYTSSLTWKSTDTIQLLLWQDNKYLIYEVKMEDGQVKRFIIDPILKTEQEQKN